MGVKDLWPFLNPYCVRKPLYELQGKTVAIDLAGWICESLCVVDYEVHARFYLRNLFFRTCYLLLSGITPVFVLEGTAPVLKHQMISKRNQIQFRGARPRKNTPDTESQEPQATAAASQASNAQKARKGRTRFNYVLKQCEELIRSMGLQCVQGPGEAEAFCAHLNAEGLVDGVISQDSDCFAYGARRVFRNFSLSMQGTAGSIGGSIDVYDLDVVEKSVDFGRNKIIVMALLCGCDYCPEGVGGVGRDAVQKLFTMYSEADILERVRLWRKNDKTYTELEMKVDDKTLCVNCGHWGRVQSHAKTGCGQCKMVHGCDSSIWKEKRLALKCELQIRKKAMLNADFPSQEIIDEFMQQPIEMDELQLGWSQPNVVKFVKMMGKLIQWDEIYCFQKFLPLLTRWQLYHIGSDDINSNDKITLRGNVQPDFIKKKRTPKGVPSYEIIWKDDDKCFECLIPDQQVDLFYSTHKEKTKTEALQLLWTTIEPMDLVEKAYPKLVEQFLASKATGKAKKTKKTQENVIKVAKGRAAKIATADENVNPVTNVAKKTRAKKPPQKPSRAVGAKGKAKADNRPIDEFFRKQNVQPSSYSSPKIKTTTKPMNLSAFDLEFNDSFELMIDHQVANLSAIINEMVARPPDVTEFKGKKLQFDAITSKQNDTLELIQSNDTNRLQPEIKNESLDEFDLIVMRKARKKSILGFDSMKATALANCSTPVISKRCAAPSTTFHLTSNNDSAVKLDARAKNRRNSVISSSFFGVNPDDEIDLFEKSLDFRNMQDISSDDESSESDFKSQSPKSQNTSDSHLSLNNYNDGDINKSDTFDRLIGFT